MRLLLATAAVLFCSCGTAKLVVGQSDPKDAAPDVRDVAADQVDTRFDTGAVLDAPPYTDAGTDSADTDATIAQCEGGAAQTAPVVVCLLDTDGTPVDISGELTATVTAVDETMATCPVSQFTTTPTLVRRVALQVDPRQIAGADLPGRFGRLRGDLPRLLSDQATLGRQLNGTTGSAASGETIVLGHLQLGTLSLSVDRNDGYLDLGGCDAWSFAGVGGFVSHP